LNFKAKKVSKFIYICNIEKQLRESRVMKKRSCIFLVICLFSTISLISCYLVQTCNAPFVIRFGLSAEPSSLTIALGSSAQSLINVSVMNNPALWTVNLSASSLSGVSTNFDPQQVTIPPSWPSGEWKSNQSILTITVSPTATPGVYTLTVYASFPSITKNATITLTIGRGAEGNNHENVTVGGYVVDSNNTPEITTEIITLMIAVIIAVPIIRYNKKPHNR